MSANVIDELYDRVFHWLDRLIRDDGVDPKLVDEAWELYRDVGDEFQRRQVDAK